MTYSEAGKGSAPRKQEDKEAYASGWDRIFGKKNETDQHTGFEAEEPDSGASNAPLCGQA